jgi:N4-gp56 family major capsid protein
MPDVFVRTTGGNAAVFHATALDLKVRWYLLRNNIFRQFADVHPLDPAHNYRTVTLTLNGELALATTPLDEVVNPDSVDIPVTRQVSVTMNEYGNTMKHTLLSRETAWNKQLPDDMVFMLAENAAATIDNRVETTLATATNIVWTDNTTAGLASAAPIEANLTGLSAKATAAAVTNLRVRRGRPKRGNNFAAIIHPNVAFDLKNEAGANVWSTPHVNVDTSEVYNGVVATYAGADFLESREVSTTTIGATAVYNSYFLGAEAILEASAIEPHLVIGEITDPMKRTVPVSWHALLGWNIFRQNSIQVVRSKTNLNVAVNQGTYDPKA